MRTTTAATAAVLRERGHSCQRQTARKHQRHGEFQRGQTTERNTRRVLCLRHTKLLRGLGHFVSLHPTGATEGSVHVCYLFTGIIYHSTPPRSYWFPLVTIILQTAPLSTSRPRYTLTLYCFR